MEINYNVDIDVYEHILLIFMLGVLEQLNSGLLDIEESEVVLFNPYMLQSLKELGVNKNILKIIELGMELDDIHRIVPQEFKNSLDNMTYECKQIIKNFSKLKYPIIRYFD